MDDLVAIAKIARPKGLKGEVFADVLTDFPERFEGLENVAAVGPDREPLNLKIEDFRFQNDRIVLKFEGYDSVEAAELLRDSEICIPESELVELEDDEFFDWQLVGCSVETLDGRRIGTVSEVQRTGGTENLLIDGDERDYLVPFAESICIEVDVENRSIKIDPPDGLLEF
jgi:16S rRNA processing protein RimM